MIVRCGSVIVLAGLLLIGSYAHADVVPAPPSSCPAGSEPATSHGGPYCRPVPCVDGKCSDGSCRTEQLCIADKLSYSRGGERTLQDAVGPCVNGACKRGTCRTMSVCVSREGLLSRCSCELGPRAQGAGPALAALLLALAVWLRRCRSL